MSLPSFQVSFDYRCPFAKNIHLHLIAALREGADFDVTFAPWTLSQGHRAKGDPDVWDDPNRNADLLALAYGVSIRDRQPDAFLDAHEALFRARHEKGIRLATHDEIASALAETSVDLDAARSDVESRRPYDVIASTYREYQRYEAFGVPTFVVNGDATFVRYMKSPSDTTRASAEIISSLVTLMAEQADLNEFKHTKVSN